MSLTDTREVEQQATSRISVAEATVAAVQAKIVDGFRRGTKANVAAMLRRLAKATTELQAALTAAAEYLAKQGLPILYSAGATDTVATIPSSVGFSWDQSHLKAVAQLSGDTYNDLLAASRQVGRTSAAFQRRVQDAAGRLSGDVREGRTAIDIGRQLAGDLRGNGVTAITYSNGARHTAQDYAAMLARTKTGAAYNAGSLGQMRRDSVGYVEFLDGAGCGLTSHDDPDKVDGTVRPVDDAEAYPISHPNCRRGFAARLDVNTAREAQDAEPSVSAASRADQAAFEAVQSQAITRRQAIRTARTARTTRTGRAA